MRITTPIAIAGGAFAAMIWITAAQRPADIPFEKVTLDLGASETAAIADLNRDGKPDIMAGDTWFASPRWAPHKFRELGFLNNYVDNFSDLVFDVDGDGLQDVVSCSWFSKRLAWWKNSGGAGRWAEAAIESGAPIEFCFLVDMDNDGKAREVLPQFGDAKQPAAWYEYRGGKWVRIVPKPRVSGTASVPRFETATSGPTSSRPKAGWKRRLIRVRARGRSTLIGTSRSIWHSCTCSM